MADHEPIYSFFALLSAGKEAQEIKRICVSADLQAELTRDFLAQAAELGDPDRIEREFDGQQALVGNEVYAISDFPLPQAIAQAVMHPGNLDDLKPDQETLARLKSVFAGAYEAQGQAFTCLFQTFNRSKVIEPKWVLIFKNNLFQKIDEHGIRLDVKMAAVFKGKKLRFLSPGIKSFLDISAYIREATDEEIQKLLKHPRLETPEPDKVLKATTSWMRNCFTAIDQSKVLDRMSPREIQESAREFGIDVKIVKKGKKEAILFPEDKTQARDLIKFLNEEFFYGILTKTRFETPVKHRVQGKKVANN